MIKFVRRGEISKEKRLGIRISAIVFALLSAGLFILLLGLNPFSVYKTMIEGSLGSSYRLKQTIINAVPLLAASLGVSAAFRMKFWNIGGEGQIFAGAFCASYIALFHNGLHQAVLIPLMMAAGFLGGAVWGLIPAFFRARWGTNETIITLMLNYVALKFITYLQFGPWKDPAALGFPKISNFPSQAVIPKVFGIHAGWIVVLALTVFMHFFMKHSKMGYETLVLGESENTARYAGIDVGKTIMKTMMLSGGICGLTGMIQASAVANTLSVEVSGGIGYTAIITAWLGGLNAFAMLFVSLVFAMLVQGGSYIQTALGVPGSAALILESLILFFVLGSDFFLRYTISFEKKQDNIKTGETVK